MVLFTMLLPKTSALTNQKERLPIRTAKAVMMTAPVTANNRKSRSLWTLKQKAQMIASPYRKSPMAEEAVAEVITLSSTLFGCTRKESSLPLMIRSGREKALAKKILAARKA